MIKWMTNKRMMQYVDGVRYPQIIPEYTVNPHTLDVAIFGRQFDRKDSLPVEIPSLALRDPEAGAIYHLKRNGDNLVVSREAYAAHNGKKILNGGPIKDIDEVRMRLGELGLDLRGISAIILQ